MPEAREPIDKKKIGEGDIAVMSIDTFEKRNQVLRLRTKIMIAESLRLSGGPTVSVEEARKRIKEKYGPFEIPSTETD